MTGKFLIKFSYYKGFYVANLEMQNVLKLSVIAFNRDNDVKQQVWFSLFCSIQNYNTNLLTFFVSL